MTDGEGSGENVRAAAPNVSEDEHYASQVAEALRAPRVELKTAELLAELARMSE